MRYQSRSLSRLDRFTVARRSRDGSTAGISPSIVCPIGSRWKVAELGSRSGNTDPTASRARARALFGGKVARARVEGEVGRAAWSRGFDLFSYSKSVPLSAPLFPRPRVVPRPECSRLLVLRAPSGNPPDPPRTIFLTAEEARVAPLVGAYVGQRLGRGPNVVVVAPSTKDIARPACEIVVPVMAVSPGNLLLSFPERRRGHRRRSRRDRPLRNFPILNDASLYSEDKVNLDRGSC